MEGRVNMNGEVVRKWNSVVLVYCKKFKGNWNNFIIKKKLNCVTAPTQRRPCKYICRKRGRFTFYH